MLYKRKNLLLIVLIGVALSSLNIAFFNCIIIGTIGFLILITGTGLWIGSRLNIKPDFFKNFWGITITITILILLNTIIYYVYGITELTTVIILLLPLFLFFIKQKKENHKYLSISLSLYLNLITYISILLDIILLILLFLNRTTGIAPSPWWTLSPWFFILYATATGFVFYSMTRQKKMESAILLASLHFFVTYCVASIIYTLGFGFDGFIHRATEVWIQTNGFILPKQPFYIGQYSFVVWLSNITSIPIFYIDVYLVPILASLSIPATIIFILKKVWKFPCDKSILLVWLIPFIPFLSLHLTTPHNILVLLSILIIFTTIGFLEEKLPFLIPLMLTLTGMATHPLLGCPMLLFVLTALVMKKVRNKPHTKGVACPTMDIGGLRHFLYHRLGSMAFWCWGKKMNIGVLILFTLTMIFIFPLMFTVYLLLSHHPLPELLNPFTQFDKFYELFTRPYWYAKQSPLVFELLYIWQRLIVPIIIISAIVGFIKKEKQFSDYIFPLGFIGFVLGAWLLRSWIIFPDVISYEQSNYPLRLLYTSIIFLLPLSIYGMNFVAEKISVYQHKGVKLISLIIISIILMISFYLSYPQHNPKARFPGYNVTAADFEAVQWIHENNQKYNYIVLSNMLTSAAALTEYSFAKHFDTVEGELFYYAIPTGGPLYKYYGKMLYEGQKREYMNEAMNLMGVDKSYFVINSYWANFKDIVEGAKKTADSWQEIGNEKIWIFEYIST